ncbi:MAG TPA: hypothetical protein VGX91_13225 [Candidatus Cybelea sp.]|jgi:hypothetical protein|nr:hypothetical protein [Candidatus Cybelea sp.]
MDRQRRELLPKGGVRRERTADAIVAAAGSGFDYPVTQAGVAGSVTVYYDPSLGAQGQALAAQLLTRAVVPFDDMESDFGISGAAVNVVIAPLSGNNDGSGGAYHYGCDFATGGTLYLDATFAVSDALDLEVLLYVAELSECFMGAQGKGWGCGYSNGEALSRFLATVETPPGTLPSGFVTGPSWANAGYPDWISKTEDTDQDDVSIGAGVVYINWMIFQKFTPTQIAQAAGATLADNYQTLTGKTTAYADLRAALAGKMVTSDNPFAPSA